MTAILQDLRHALRRLAGAPGFAALAVTTLALAIGAHTAVFGLVHRLLLRPLPVADPDRLVGVYETRDGEGFSPLSYPDYADYRDATRVFAALAAHYPTAPLSLRAGDRLEEVNGSVVSAGYFPLLGIEPARGRFFLPEEDAVPDAHPVAVVSYRLWRTRLGGRDDAVGSVVWLNGTPFTVVGVAPEGFEGVRPRIPSEVWIPTTMARVGYRWCERASRDCTWLNLIGRLAPGRTLADARAEMTALARRVRRAHPAGDGVVRDLAVAPLDPVHPAARPALVRLSGLLLAAVTLVLVVAAANLGGLLLARGVVRRREIATRLALGASRARVAGLFVAEALVLSIAGGAAGLVAAGWVGWLVGRLFPGDVPLDLDLAPAVLGYAGALSVVCGLAVGAVPGLQASRRNLVPSLRDHRRPRLLGLLVVCQMALSFVLLACTGLLARSLASFDRVGGLDPSAVAVLRLRPRLVGYDPQRGQAFTREAVRRLAAVPGVRSVGVSAGQPPLPFFNPVRVARPGHGTAGGGGVEAWADEIGPGLLDTLGIAVLSGRDVGRHDVAGSPPVAIVNRTLAAALWPGGDAVGERLEAGGRGYRVIGVVEDEAYLSAGQPPHRQLYTAYWQDPANADARLSVRAAGGDAAPLLPELRRAIDAIDPAVPVTEVGTMRARLEREFAPVFLVSRVVAASGVLALLLAAVGLYGVLALVVAQRTRDIGIRMALGSSRRRVVGLVLRDSLGLAAVALLPGLAAAMAASRALGHYLYGVGPGDPAAFAAALAAVAAIAGLASWWPARRASRVDPLVALRHL